MTAKPPSPWDKASIRTADTRKRENTGPRQQAASSNREERPAVRHESGNKQ